MRFATAFREQLESLTALRSFSLAQCIRSSARHHPGLSPAAKTALVGLIKSLAIGFAPDRIRRQVGRAGLDQTEISRRGREIGIQRQGGGALAERRMGRTRRTRRRRDLPCVAGVASCEWRDDSRRRRICRVVMTLSPDRAAAGRQSGVRHGDVTSPPSDGRVPLQSPTPMRPIPSHNRRYGSRLACVPLVAAMLALVCLFAAISAQGQTPPAPTAPSAPAAAGYSASRAAAKRRARRH